MNNVDTDDVQDSPFVLLTKYLISLMSGMSNGSASMNLTTVMVALNRLSSAELQVLYNISGARNSDEFLHLLNMTITLRMERMQELDLTMFYQYKLSKLLLLYVAPIILIVGTVGNTFSFVVLRRKPMAKVSTYIYLASLAITDTMVLYIGLLRLWLIVLTGVDYHATSGLVCKLCVLVGYSASNLSVWLIIAVTVERFIVVCFPFRANVMCNVSRAKKVIGFLTFLFLVIYLHFLWTVNVSEKGECGAAPGFSTLVETVWPWVDAGIYSFFPFVIIMFLNVLIIKEVKGAQSTRVRLGATSEYTSSRVHTSGATTALNANAHGPGLGRGHGHAHHFSRQNAGSGTNSASTTTATTATSAAAKKPADHQGRQQAGEKARLTVMLLTVSFTFLLLTLPVNIALIFTKYWNQNVRQTKTNLEIYRQSASFHLAKAVIELLMYTNHSINFFLYCATGHKFRQQVLLLFRCLRRVSCCPSLGKRALRKTSASILGQMSDLTQSSRFGRRKSSCISLDVVETRLQQQQQQQQQQHNHHHHHNQHQHHYNNSISSSNNSGGGSSLSYTYVTPCHSSREDSSPRGHGGGIGGVGAMEVQVKMGAKEDMTSTAISTNAKASCRSLSGGALDASSEEYHFPSSPIKSSNVRKFLLTIEDATKPRKKGGNRRSGGGGGGGCACGAFGGHSTKSYAKNGGVNRFRKLRTSQSDNFPSNSSSSSSSTSLIAGGCRVVYSSKKMNSAPVQRRITRHYNALEQSCRRDEERGGDGTRGDSQLDRVASSQF